MMRSSPFFKSNNKSGDANEKGEDKIMGGEKMKKTKKLCLLAIAITFLLSGLPYPVYGVKSLAPASRYDGRGEEDEEHKRQVLQVLWFTNLEASRIIKENFTEEQIRYLAKALASLFVAGKFTPESIEELLREERLGTLDADERRGLAYQIHSMLGFVPVEIAKEKESAPLALSDIPADILEGKTAFVRADVNVKYVNGKVREDDEKIIKLFRIVDNIMEKEMRAVIATHKGRPEGYDAKESVKPIYEILAKKYGKDKIGFLDFKELGKEALSTQKALELMEKEGYQIVLLDNLRFIPEEKGGDEDFARSLVEGVDLYIFDGPAVAHRPKHASVSAAQFAPLSVLGTVAQEEKDIMEQYLDADLTFYGGAKNVDKLKRNKDGSINFAKSEGKMFALYGDLLAAKRLNKKIFIGGTMLNSFLAAKGFQLGNSRGCSPEEIEVARAILEKIKELGIEENVIIPQNLTIAKVVENPDGSERYEDINPSFDISKENPVPDSYVVLASYAVLDIGKEAVKDGLELIKAAKKIDWNGSMGKTDVAEFRMGTDELLRFISGRAEKGEIECLIAGGDSAVDAKRIWMSNKANLITGGGAYLVFKALQGKMKIYEEFLTQCKPDMPTEEIREFVKAKLSPVAEIEQFAKPSSEIDLQEFSGLPIKLGADNKLIFGEGLTKVVPAVRMLKADGIKDKEGLEKVVKDPTIITEANKDTILYHMYRAIYEDEDLRYDITVIPPAMLGSEYVKTTGHFHPGLYPEVYEVLSGEAYYLLQKKDGSDFIIVHARKGDKVVIPPDYGHITVNAGKKTLVMANWVSNRFKSEYGEIKKKRGAMYYLEEGEDGELEITRNPNYEDVPGIRVMRPADLIDRFGLERNVPMYSLISEAPEKLDFLNNPEKYEEAFAKALIEVKTTDVETILAATEKELAELIGVGTQPGQLKNKALYVSWEILLDTVGIEKFFKKLDSLLSKSESTCVKIVIPDFPRDGKIPDNLKRMLPTLVKLGEGYRSLEIVTEADAKREIEDKSERLTELRNIAAVVKEETQTDWWHKVLDSMVIKIAKPTKEQISLVLVAIISGFDILVDSQISLPQLRNWLEENYKGKIKSEQISRLLYHLSMNLAFEPVEPTTAFLEDYQLLLKREELLRQAG